MKILFLSPNQSHKYNPGNQHFRDEVARQHEVHFVGPGWGDWERNDVKKSRDASRIARSIKDLDCIMTYGMKYTVAHFHNIDKIRLPKVHFQDDIFPSVPGFRGTLSQYLHHLKEVKYDLVFCRTTRAMKIVKGVCKKVSLLSHGVNTDYFFPNGSGKTLDVATPMSHVKVVYPNRKNVCSLIDSMPIMSITKRVFDQKYVDTIRESKIVVNSVCRWGSFNFKFTEVPSCGTFLLSDRALDLDFNGFKDGTHLVVYHNLTDLRSKIEYYLRHEDEREEIADKGMLFVRKYHSLTSKIKTMTTIIDNVL